jgi:hypothetical protein
MTDVEGVSAETSRFVEFRSDDDFSAVLRLSFGRDASGVGLDLFTVQIRTPELTCDHGVLTSGGDGLEGFLAGLARGWHGWDGTRRWDALEHGMSVEATHRGRVVELLFIVRRDYEQDAWELRLPILIAPGESLTRITSETSALIRESN